MKKNASDDEEEDNEEEKKKDKKKKIKRKIKTMMMKNQKVVRQNQIPSLSLTSSMINLLSSGGSFVTYDLISNFFSGS